MKTTIELPDDLLRRAKATAAERGISLKSFIGEAIRTRLANERGSGPAPKPWMTVTADLPDVPQDQLRRVDEIIAANRRQDLELRGEEP